MVTASRVTVRRWVILIALAAFSGLAGVFGAVLVQEHFQRAALIHLRGQQIAQLEREITDLQGEVVAGRSMNVFQQRQIGLLQEQIRSLGAVPKVYVTPATPMASPVPSAYPSPVPGPTQTVTASPHPQPSPSPSCTRVPDSNRCVPI